MNNKSKKLIIYGIALLAVLLVGGISYAYFAAQLNGLESESTIYGQAGEMSITFADGNPNIEENGISPDSNTPWATKTFTVTGTNTVNNKTMPYTLSLIVDLNELTLSNMAYTLESTNTSNNGATAPSVMIQTEITTTTTPLGTGFFLKGTGKVHTYVLKIYYPDSDTINQSGDMGKKFAAHVGITSDKSYTDIGAVTLMSKVGTTTNGGLNAVAQQETIQTPAQTDYRYYGANPDNWAYFNCSASDGTYDYGDLNYNYASNCELWRIIGVFDAETPVYTGSTITSYKTEKKIKLIRNESIGKYSWDVSVSTVNDGLGINEWSQADIMKLLNPGFETNQDLDSSNNTITVNNSLYWNRQSGTCYSSASNVTTSCDFTSTGIKNETKNYISESKYYTAGDDEEEVGDDFSKIRSSEMYSYERGNLVTVPGVTCSGTSCNDTVTRKTNSPSYIGLMYASDFGYAADENDKYINWLEDDTKAFITPYVSNANRIVYAHEYDLSYANTSDEQTVHPVLYLNSGVYILGGNGTFASPYKFVL